MLKIMQNIRKGTKGSIIQTSNPMSPNIKRCCGYILITLYGVNMLHQLRSWQVRLSVKPDERCFPGKRVIVALRLQGVWQWG